jgi:acyl-coenzyme A synthetase/AMP-(fatty) acid ligase
MAGRLKTEINRAGEKVLPEEVDILLEKHPAVVEACTFGIPDAIQGEVVATAVRLVDETISPTELKNWCMERIRMYCIPDKWYVVSEIPKTDRGKINRANVRDKCLSGEI